MKFIKGQLLKLIDRLSKKASDKLEILAICKDIIVLDGMIRDTDDNIQEFLDGMKQSLMDNKKGE